MYQHERRRRLTYVRVALESVLFAAGTVGVLVMAIGRRA